MNAELRRKAKRKQWDQRFLNGKPETRRALRPIIMEAVARGLVVTSTTGGRHAPTSFHYSGRAVDIGVESWSPLSTARLLAFQRHLHKVHGRGLAELFGPNNYANRKWGRPLRMPEGSGLESLHDNHVHVAVA